MARSEYSRLRSIAEKRIDRLSSHGLASPGISFPKVSQLKSAAEKKAALNAVKSFLASGTTLREAAKNPEKRLVTENNMPAFLTEKQAKEAERRERRNAKRRERYAATKNLTTKQKGLLKGAAKLGLRIPTDKIQSFIEYMEYRFAQVRESQFYAMATYTEDYEAILKKSPTKEDIIADFERYLADKENTTNMFDKSTGYSEEQLNSIWKDFARDFR